MEFKPRLVAFIALVLQTVPIVLILHFSAGHSDLICSHQPIVALTGDNVILPCCLEPAISAGTVEWTKPGLDPTNIHVHQDGRLEHRTQNPSYNYRTRLFVDELEQGNVSMKIFSVKLSDEGKYRCYIPAVQKDAFVQLVVGSVSSPVVKATNSTFSGVVLHCESKGWYPEPELLWLDGEGKLLSAGPTETVRGPDDLYTVSSRVTVEKRHSNNFTCRVQQKIINQTRETQIHVPDDFFMTQSTSSSPASIIGLVAGILIIISIITVAIIFRKRRKKKIKTSGNRGSNDETGQNRTQSGSDGAEVQPLAEGGETEKLRTENAESEHGGGESENYTHARDTVSYRGGKKGRAANDRGKGNLQRCC